MNGDGSEEQTAFTTHCCSLLVTGRSSKGNVALAPRRRRLWPKRESKLLAGGAETRRLGVESQSRGCCCQACVGASAARLPARQTKTNEHQAIDRAFISPSSPFNSARSYPPPSSPLKESKRNGQESIKAHARAARRPAKEHIL